MLRARFQDAQFFYEEDLKTPLADFRRQLAGTLFQKDLGTLLDKSVPLKYFTSPIPAPHRRLRMRVHH